MSYTPPAASQIVFELVGPYTPPAANTVDFELGVDDIDPANLAVTIDGTTAQLSWDASPLLT